MPTGTTKIWPRQTGITVGRPVKITAIAQLYRAFNFVKRIGKSRCVLLLSSSKLHTLSMLSGTLKNQPKKKSGRTIAPSAPPPPGSLL